MATQDSPGLAMSRSLGDGVAHACGVSWEPEVKQFRLTKNDRFMIIASDGVWEFITNQEAAHIVKPFFLRNSPELAGNALVRESVKRWKMNDTVIDDVTCITIFMEID